MDDIFLREILGGGGDFLPIDRLGEEGLTFVTRGAAPWLENDEVFTLRVAVDSEERATIEPTGSPQQLMFFWTTCPINGVNRIKDKGTDLAICEVRFVCILSILTYVYG